MHFLKNDELDISVRWLIRRDLSEVMTIESSSFEDPVTEQKMIGWLRCRNIVGMVAEKDLSCSRLHDLLPRKESPSAFSFSGC